MQPEAAARSPDAALSGRRPPWPIPSRNADSPQLRLNVQRSEAAQEMTGERVRIRAVAGELWGIALLFLVRGSGLGATFLAGVLLARQFGASTNGLFQLGIAYVTVLGAVARLGQDQLNLRTMAELRAREDAMRARQEMIRSLLVAAPLAALAAVALALVAYAKEAPEQATFLTTFSLSVIPFASLWILTEGLRGWQHVQSAMFWQGACAPVVFIALLAAWSSSADPNIDWLPYLYAVSIVIAVIGAGWSWSRAVKGAATLPTEGAASANWRHRIRDGRTFWMLTILVSVSGWVDLIILYAVADAETVGIFFAVARTGALIAVALNIAAAGAVARLALLYAGEKFTEFARVLRFYWLVFAGGAFMAGLIFTVAAGPIMSIWGPETAPFSSEFLIYVAVQMIQAVFILPQMVAPVVGLEKKIFQLNILILPAKAIAVYIGYSAGGLMGVIVAVGAAMIATAGVTAIIFLRHLHRRDPALRRLLWT